jgi:hypothetical protein
MFKLSEGHTAHAKQPTHATNGSPLLCCTNDCWEGVTRYDACIRHAAPLRITQRWWTLGYDSRQEASILLVKGLGIKPQFG